MTHNPSEFHHEKAYVLCVRGLVRLFVLRGYAFSADPNRQEVEKRFELNSATAEELAGTGAVSLEVAKKIVELRDQLGSFQSYDDLNELELPKDQMDKLRWNTTIQGIASDCNC